MGDISVYVISLRDSEVRRRKMTERLDALSIPFQFVDAIDGRYQRLPDEFDGARVVRDAFHSEAALGCAMSHRRVHRMIVDGPDDLALVLEDDAEPDPDFPNALALAATLRFDVLKFEGGPWGRRAKVGQLGKYRVMAGTASLGAAAYLIRKAAAARFCAFPILDQITDIAFGDLRLGLRVLDLEPYPVKQDATLTQLDYQQFRPSPTARLGRFAQLGLSIRKRAMFVRLYGLRAAIKMDLGRITGTTW